MCCFVCCIYVPVSVQNDFGVIQFQDFNILIKIIIKCICLLQFIMPYKLSSILLGHKADILGLAVTSDDCIVSCSRDKTAKLWKPNKFTNLFTEAEIYINDQQLSSKFITCICVLPPSDSFQNGLVITGGNDSHIFVYEPDCSVPMKQLVGHTNTVCRLVNSTEPNVFLSASWDTTVKMWFISDKQAECILTIKSHQLSVWAVLHMKCNLILSGSADKTIRVFSANGSLIKIFTGHEDCVRDLVEINDDEILSCSNDTTIRRWSVSKGACLEILYGHPNYVYSIRIFGDTVVSSGEDRCLLLWSKGKHLQTITLPARSVWTVALLSNNDIVTGSSDGVIRIFTNDTKRQADDKTLAVFANECSNFTVPFKRYVGRSKVSRLPGPETLAEPGIKEGQTKTVRELTKVVCYSWSLEEKTWKKIGDVEAAPLSSKATKIRADISDYLCNNKNNSSKEWKDFFTCAVCKRTYSRKYLLLKHFQKSSHSIANKVPPYLQSILPRTHFYYVSNFRRKGSNFKVEICLPSVNSVNDLHEWIRLFAELNKCVYIRNSTKKNNRGLSAYSEFYRCQHATMSKKSRKKRTKATGCKSTIHGVIKRDFNGIPCYVKIIINFAHNHSTEYTQKFKKPSFEVQDIFRAMFKDGLNPSNALRNYKRQLELKSPEIYDTILKDRSICPDYSWVRHFYRKTKTNRNNLMKSETSSMCENTESITYSDHCEQIEHTILNSCIEEVQIDDVCDNEIKTVSTETECLKLDIEEMIMEIEIEQENDNHSSNLDKLEESFGQFVDRLEEDPRYYENGIVSMCNELKRICNSSAASRLSALYSFNKNKKNMSVGETM